MDTFDVALCAACHRYRVVEADKRCSCGAKALQEKAPRLLFAVDGKTLSVVVPNDPVAWRLRVASAQEARRLAPYYAQQFAAGKPPQEAVHRGLAREMAKGSERDTYIRLSTGAVLEMLRLLKGESGGNH